MQPCNPLEHALVAAATDPAARPRFLQLLLESPLFVIDGGSEPPTQAGTLAVGTKLQLVTTHLDGVLHLAAFTSLEMLQRYLGEPGRYLSMTGRDLLNLARGSHVILNPGASYGKVFLPAEIEEILGGPPAGRHAQMTIDKATTVLLGEPANYPLHLTETLAQLFKSRREVRAAHLQLCEWPDSGRQNPLIGIDTTGDWDELMRDVTSTLERSSRPDLIVDFIQMNDSAIADMLRRARPFYRRKFLGIF